MASEDSDWSNLVMVIVASDTIQGLVTELLNYFEPKSMPEGKGYALLDYKPEGVNVLNSIKEEVRKGFTTILDIVKAIVPKPQKNYFMSPIQLLTFREGTLDLVSMVGEPEVCIILIPVAVIGSGEAKLDDPKTKQTKTIKFATNVEIIVNGRCKMHLGRGDKIACAVLCIGRDKGTDQNKDKGKDKSKG